MRHILEYLRVPGLGSTLQLINCLKMVKSDTIGTNVFFFYVTK